MYEYESVRRLVYGEERATFIPVCSKCSRFVKADKSITLKGDTLDRRPNATCKKCGRVEMLFEGFV